MKHLSLRELCEGNLEGGFFTGDPEAYVKKGSRDGHISRWGPHWVTWKGAYLPGTYM